MKDKQPRIRLRWSKKEQDVEVAWDAQANGKPNAGMVLTHFTWTPTLHELTFVKELERRGYDLTTLRFSIERKPPG